MKFIESEEEEVPMGHTEVSNESAEPHPSSPLNSEKAVIEELDGPWSTVGDLEAIEKDLLRAQRAVDRARNWSMSNETVEKAETRKAEMEEKRRVTVGARQRFEVRNQSISGLL